MLQPRPDPVKFQLSRTALSSPAMASHPQPVRKPTGVVRPPASPRRRRKNGPSIPPALLSAVLLAAFGGAAWWFIQSKTPDPAPVADLAAGDAAKISEPEAPTPPVPAPAAVVPAPAVATAPVVPEPAPATPAAEPTPEGPKPIFERLLVYDTIGAAKKENATWHTEALTLAKQTNRWDDYRDLLGRSLAAFALKEGDTASISSDPLAGPALIRHAFLSDVSEKVLKPLFADEESSSFAAWLLDTPEAMQAFTRQLDAKDDVEKAIRLWASIAAESPAAQTDYRELAIACALVFDRTIKVDQDRYAEKLNGLSRFSYYHDNDVAGKLTGKIKQMSAADLVWVVGVPISQKELEWALKKADFRRKSWGQAYGSIKYDMEKAVTGKSEYDEYTFSEIQKKGGICSDQAYFSAWTACAHGIPAAIIGGDGARGPHAWMTWQADDGEWKFSGRFSGYPAGDSRNPQTGQSISEEEFLRLSDKKASNPPAVLKAKQALWIADLFRDQPERAAVFLTEAVKAAPRLTEASAALLAHWVEHRSTATVEEWTGLLKDLRKNFRDAESLMDDANEAEEKFVFTRQESTAVMKDLRREARKVGDTAGPEAGVATDLGRLTAGLRRQAEVFKANKDADGIRSLYRRALADHGSDAATFKALAKDYFAYCKAEAETALKACRELESACRRSVGRGKGDWFDVTSQNSAWRVVAECYRAAGDGGKADLIVRDCDSREKAAKKKAI
ncbi:MAG: hypothetical protein JWL81_3210 [Verrucomicrobiales bacterium]|nr:hypothetical protein [Verrucomicrobiales bacterium]